MYSITEEQAVKFYYERPNVCLNGLPIHKDTLKFEGKNNGQRYQGKAYVFTKNCGGKSIGYPMSGSENDDHTLITLRGLAPLIEPEACQVVDRTPASPNSTHKIEARELKAKAKPINQPDEIRR